MFPCSGVSGLILSKGSPKVYYLDTQFAANEYLNRYTVAKISNKWKINEAVVTASFSNGAWNLEANVYHPPALDKVITDKTPITTVSYFLVNVDPEEEATMRFVTQQFRPCKQLSDVKFSTFVTINGKYLRLKIDDLERCNLVTNDGISISCIKGLCTTPYRRNLKVRTFEWKDALDVPDQMQYVQHTSYAYAEQDGNIRTALSNLAKGATQEFHNITHWFTGLFVTAEKYMYYFMLLVLIVVFPGIMLTKVGVIAIIISLVYIQMTFAAAFQLSPENDRLMIQTLDISMFLISTFQHTSIPCSIAQAIVVFTTLTRGKEEPEVRYHQILKFFLLINDSLIKYLAFPIYIFLIYYDHEKLKAYFMELSNKYDIKVSLYKPNFSEHFSRVYKPDLSTFLKTFKYVKSQFIGFKINIRRLRNRLRTKIHQRATDLFEADERVVVTLNRVNRLPFVPPTPHFKKKNVRNLAGVFFYYEEYRLYMDVLSRMNSKEIENLYQRKATIAARLPFDIRMLQGIVNDNTFINLSKINAQLSI